MKSIDAFAIMLSILVVGIGINLRLGRISDAIRETPHACTVAVTTTNTVQPVEVRTIRETVQPQPWHVEPGPQFHTLPGGPVTNMPFITNGFFYVTAPVGGQRTVNWQEVKP